MKTASLLIWIIITLIDHYFIFISIFSINWYLFFLENILRLIISTLIYTTDLLLIRLIIMIIGYLSIWNWEIFDSIIKFWKQIIFFIKAQVILILMEDILLKRNWSLHSFLLFFLITFNTWWGIIRIILFFCRNFLYFLQIAFAVYHFFLYINMKIILN